jgi:hypothetical protein
VSEGFFPRMKFERSPPRKRRSSEPVTGNRTPATGFNALLQLNILQTVVFSDHIYPPELARAKVETHMQCAEKGLTPLDRTQKLSGTTTLVLNSMVKLLRAYGECLGAKCR